MTVFIGKDPSLATTGDATFGNMQFFRSFNFLTGTGIGPLSGPTLPFDFTNYPANTLFFLNGNGGVGIDIGTYVSDGSTWTATEFGSVIIDQTARIYRYRTGNNPLAPADPITFAENFTSDFPATLVCDRINQIGSAPIINLDKTTIIFEEGSPNLNANGSSIFANDVDATPTWNITNCYIGCTTPNVVNGFGQVGGNGLVAGVDVQGTMSNVEFFGINGSTWFINLAGTDDSFAVSNILYNQSAVHNNIVADFIQGSTFDGTTRNLGGHTAYTVRIVNNPNLFTITHNNRFDGTNYSTTDGDTNGDNITHYDQSTLGSHSLYSINNLYENAMLAFNVSDNVQNDGITNSLTVVEGYTWNPVLRNAGTSIRVSDLHLLDLPAPTRRVPATIDTTAEWVTITETHEIANPNGYFIVKGTETQDVRRSSKVSVKALDYAASVENGVTNDVLTPLITNQFFTAKSYALILDNETIQPQVDKLSDTVTGNGSTIEYAQEHTLSRGAEDPVNTLNNKSFAAAEILTAIVSFDDLYPAIKSQWVQNGEDQVLPIVKNGTTLTFNAVTTITEVDLALASTPTVSDQAGVAEITLHSDPDDFGSSSVAVTTLAFTRNSTVSVSINKSGAELTTDTSSRTVNMLNTTSSGPLTLSTGTFTDMGTGIETFHDLTLDNTIVQLPAPTATNQPLDLGAAWGDVTLVGTVTLNTANSNPADNFNWSVSGAPAGLLSGPGIDLATSLTVTLPTTGNPRLSVYPVEADGMHSVFAPVHTFTASGVASDIVGLGTARIVTVFTSDTAVPEVREYEVVSGGNVDLIVTNTDDPLRLTPNTTILGLINAPTPTINITSVEFRTADDPSSGLEVRTRGFGDIAGVAGQSFLFASKLRNTEAHHRSVVSVLQLGASITDTNIYNTSSQRITFNGSSFISVDSDFFILPTIGASSQQVAVLDRDDPNNIGIYGSYTVVDGADPDISAVVRTTALSTAAIDYARIGLVFDAANAEAFSEQLDKIERINSYLVSDGNPLDPQPTDALLGIKPKRGGYDNTVSWEDNI